MQLKRVFINRVEVRVAITGRVIRSLKIRLLSAQDPYGSW